MNIDDKVRAALRAEPTDAPEHAERWQRFESRARRRSVRDISVIATTCVLLVAAAAGIFKAADHAPADLFEPTPSTHQNGCGTDALAMRCKRAVAGILAEYRYASPKVLSITRMSERTFARLSQVALGFGNAPSTDDEVVVVAIEGRNLRGSRCPRRACGPFRHGVLMVPLQDKTETASHVTLFGDPDRVRAWMLARGFMDARIRGVDAGFALAQGAQPEHLYARRDVAAPGRYVTFELIGVAADLKSGRFEFDARIHERSGDLVQVRLERLSVAPGKNIFGTYLPLTVALSDARPPADESRTASVTGQVQDPDGRAIAYAEVLVQPHGVWVVTDQNGDFSIPRIALSRSCQLVTFEVTRTGYGRWRSIDNPLYEGKDHYLDVAMSEKPQEDVVGPPLTGGSACKR